MSWQYWETCFAFNLASIYIHDANVYTYIRPTQKEQNKCPINWMASPSRECHKIQLSPVNCFSVHNRTHFMIKYFTFFINYFIFSSQESNSLLFSIKDDSSIDEPQTHSVEFFTFVFNYFSNILEIMYTFMHQWWLNCMNHKCRGRIY